MDRRAGILGIAVPSGPINLSSSQESSRTALPSGFKREPGRKREIPEWLFPTEYRPLHRLFREYLSRMDFALSFDVFVKSRTFVNRISDEAN